MAEKQNVSQENILGIRDLIQRYYKVKVHLRDVKLLALNLLKDDKEYWEDEFRYKSYDDTAPREILVYHLSTFFLGQGWPINGDPDSVKDAFYTKLQEVAKKRKWKLLFKVEEQ